MINNIDLLLIVSYIERAYDPRIPVDEREFLRLQFERAIEPQNNIDRRYSLSTALENYAELWRVDGSIAQAMEIPLVAHRWFWKQITDQETAFPVQRFRNGDLTRAYFELKDPFIRYDIIRYFVFQNSQIVTGIIRAMSFDRVPIDQSLSGELQELLDILFDIQVSSDEPEQILRIVFNLISLNADILLEPLRAFVRLRTEYLDGPTGQQIRGILGLDDES